MKSKENKTCVYASDGKTLYIGVLPTHISLTHISLTNNIKSNGEERR